MSCKMQKNQNYKRNYQTIKIGKVKQKMSIFCIETLCVGSVLDPSPTLDFASRRRNGAGMTSMTSLVVNSSDRQPVTESPIRDSRSVIRALRSRMDGKLITIVSRTLD